MKRYFGYALLVNLLLVVCLFFYRNELPSASSIDSLLKTEPLQIATTEQPFYVATKDFRFYVEPVYEYRLYGLVVSKYNARKNFMARIDRSLNVTDICVLWGENAFSGIYKRLSFWSGEFTCFVKGSSKQPMYFYGAAYQQLDPDRLPAGTGLFNVDLWSNNHLLVEDAALAKQLKDVNIGDQIYFSGYLVNYGTSPNQIFRHTSTVRTDTGNGACETVYINSFMVLHKNPYRQAFNFFLISCCCLLVIWFAYQWNSYKANHRSE